MNQNADYYVPSSAARSLNIFENASIAGTIR